MAGRGLCQRQQAAARPMPEHPAASTTSRDVCRVNRLHPMLDDVAQRHSGRRGCHHLACLSGPQRMRPQVNQSSPLKRAKDSAHGFRLQRARCSQSRRRQRRHLTSAVSTDVI